MSVSQTSGGTVSSAACWGCGCCGCCGPRLVVMVTFGLLACAALLLAVRLAVSFEVQPEMTRAASAKAKAVSESRPAVQKRFLSCACFMFDSAFELKDEGGGMRDEVKATCFPSSLIPHPSS